MRKNLKIIMSWLAEYEGGFVNHPKDPGGATNRGVTQRVYDAFRKRNGWPPRSVRSITDAEHDAIYLRQYWLPARGDELPSGIDASVFDMAVHSGVSRAAKTLQSVIGVKADGVIGEITLARLSDLIAAQGRQVIIKEFNKRRMAFMRRLKTFKTFGKGWTRRVMGRFDGAQHDDVGVVDRSIMLAQGFGHIPKPRYATEGRADDADIGGIGNLIEVLSTLFARLFSGKKRRVA